jgi:hypothetical protein
MAAFALVRVLISIFTQETNAGKLRDYLWNCLTDGMASVLFASPAVLAAFYTAGNDAYDALALAITNYELNDSNRNLRIVKAKMALAVLWLRDYANQVQVIANLPVNVVVRQDAADNISTSFLTPQKLAQSSKGAPEVPVLSGKRGAIEGGIDIEVMNHGVGFNPTSINFIAVLLTDTPVTEPPTPTIPDPVVTLTAGQVLVSSAVATQVASISLDGKGKFISFVGLMSGRRYAIYAYTKNGKKLVSVLSAPIIVQA